MAKLIVAVPPTSPHKVAVNTDIDDVKEFLDHVVKSTNMKCLTPPSALEGESGTLTLTLALT